MKMSNKTYDVLKWIALVGLSAVGTLYSALSAIWGFPYGEQVVSTIVALEVFLGAILQLSTSKYNKTNN